MIRHPVVGEVREARRPSIVQTDSAKAVCVHDLVCSHPQPPPVQRGAKFLREYVAGAFPAMLLVSFSTSVRFPIMVRVSAMLSVPAFVDAETLANAPDERC